MKKQKIKTPKPRGRSSRRDPQSTEQPAAEHEPPDPLEAALEVAARLAAPYPEEAASINKVIRFFRQNRHGQPAKVRLSDVLLALSIVLSATEHTLTPEEHEMLAMLDFLLGVTMPAGMVRVPGAPAPLPLAITPHRCAPRASDDPPLPPFPALHRLAA